MSCDCKNMKEFYTCKYGCNPSDSVQYCRKPAQGTKPVAGALASPLITTTGQVSAMLQNHIPGVRNMVGLVSAAHIGFVPVK